MYEIIDFAKLNSTKFKNRVNRIIKQKRREEYDIRSKILYEDR